MCIQTVLKAHRSYKETKESPLCPNPAAGRSRGQKACPFHLLPAELPTERACREPSSRPLPAATEAFPFRYRLETNFCSIHAYFAPIPQCHRFSLTLISQSETRTHASCSASQI